MALQEHNGRFMEEMTVQDMILALEQTRTAILACGGTEQHGYHLPLSTDYLVAYEVSKEVSRRSGCLVLPPLCYSFSGGKLPGTTDISPETTAQVVTEIGLSIADQGVRNVVLFVGHCGAEHLHAVKEAGYRMMEQAPGVAVAFAPILSLSKTWIGLLGGGGEHAGKGETSLVLHIRPDLVRDERPYDTDETRKPRKPDYIVEDLVLKPRPKERPAREAPYKYGVSGANAQEATAEFGKTLYDEMVETLVDLVQSMEQNAG